MEAVDSGRFSLGKGKSLKNLTKGVIVIYQSGSRGKSVKRLPEELKTWRAPLQPLLGHPQRDSWALLQL